MFHDACLLSGGNGIDLAPTVRALLDIGIITFRISAVIPIAGSQWLLGLRRWGAFDINRWFGRNRDYRWIIRIIRVGKIGTWVKWQTKIEAEARMSVIAIKSAAAEMSASMEWVGISAAAGQQCS